MNISILRAAGRLHWRDTTKLKKKHATFTNKPRWNLSAFLPRPAIYVKILGWKPFDDFPLTYYTTVTASDKNLKASRGVVVYLATGPDILWSSDSLWKTSRLRGMPGTNLNVFENSGKGEKSLDLSMDSSAERSHFFSRKSSESSGRRSEGARLTGWSQRRFPVV